MNSLALVSTVLAIYKKAKNIFNMAKINLSIIYNNLRLD